MFQAFARRSSKPEEDAVSTGRVHAGVAIKPPAFRPPTVPGALPKPANFTFSPDRDRPLEKGIQAALPTRISMQSQFWGAVSLVLLSTVGAIHSTSASTANIWFLLGAVVVAVVFGGMAGWAHIMASATRRLPGVIREALTEMPSRYETMRRAKAEKGIQAPLWLSYAMAGLMADVVWPITTQVLRDRLGMVWWLPLRPVRRVFSSSAGYASSVIRNQHTRDQHLQSVLLTSSVVASAETLTEEDGASALEDVVWDDPAGCAYSHDRSDRATQTSLREAVDASMDDIERVAVADARRLWWTMTTFAALTYATALTLLAAAWLLG